MGGLVGVTEAQLRDLSRHDASDAFSDTERLVLRLAEVLTRSPVEVPEGVVADLRALLSESAVVELVAMICWENYRARCNRAFGIRAAGFSDGGVCALPDEPG